MGVTTDSVVARATMQPPNWSESGPMLPTWETRQVVSNLGYTGRAAYPLGGARQGGLGPLFASDNSLDANPLSLPGTLQRAASPSAIQPPLT
jgi:hypothetical protein